MHLFTSTTETYKDYFGLIFKPESHRERIYIRCYKYRSIAVGQRRVDSKFRGSRGDEAHYFNSEFEMSLLTSSPTIEVNRHLTPALFPISWRRGGIGADLHPLLQGLGVSFSSSCVRVRVPDRAGCGFRASFPRFGKRLPNITERFPNIGKPLPKFWK